MSIKIFHALTISFAELMTCISYGKVLLIDKSFYSFDEYLLTDIR